MTASKSQSSLLSFGFSSKRTRERTAESDSLSDKTLKLAEIPAKAAKKTQYSDQDRMEIMKADLAKKRSQSNESARARFSGSEYFQAPNVQLVESTDFNIAIPTFHLRGNETQTRIPDIDCLRLNYHARELGKLSTPEWSYEFRLDDKKVAVVVPESDIKPLNNISCIPLVCFESKHEFLMGSNDGEAIRAITECIKNGPYFDRYDEASETSDSSFSDCCKSSLFYGSHESICPQNDLEDLPNCILLHSEREMDLSHFIRTFAENAGFDVMEISANSRRNKNDVISALAESSQSHSVSSFGKRRILLVEQADVIFEDDNGFWRGILQLAEASKRQIIMTCSDLTVLPQEICLVLDRGTPIRLISLSGPSECDRFSLKYHHNSIILEPLSTLQEGLVSYELREENWQNLQLVLNSLEDSAAERLSRLIDIDNFNTSYAVLDMLSASCGHLIETATSPINNLSPSLNCSDPIILGRNILIDHDSTTDSFSLAHAETLCNVAIAMASRISTGSPIVRKFAETKSVLQMKTDSNEFGRHIYEELVPYSVVMLRSDSLAQGKRRQRRNQRFSKEKHDFAAQYIQSRND